MIAHQAVCQDRMTKPGAPICSHIEERKAVIVVEEDALPVVPPQGHVVDGSWSIEPGLSGHWLARLEQKSITRKPDPGQVTRSRRRRERIRRL